MATEYSGSKRGGGAVSVLSNDSYLVDTFGGIALRRDELMMFAKAKADDEPKYCSST